MTFPLSLSTPFTLPPIPLSIPISPPLPFPSPTPLFPLPLPWPTDTSEPLRSWQWLHGDGSGVRTKTLRDSVRKETLSKPSLQFITRNLFFSLLPLLLLLPASHLRVRELPNKGCLSTGSDCRNAPGREESPALTPTSVGHFHIELSPYVCCSWGMMRFVGRGGK